MYITCIILFSSLQNICQPDLSHTVHNETLYGDVDDNFSDPGELSPIRTSTPDYETFSNIQPLFASMEANVSSKLDKITTFISKLSGRVNSNEDQLQSHICFSTPSSISSTPTCSSTESDSSTGQRKRKFPLELQVYIYLSV